MTTSAKAGAFGRVTLEWDAHYERVVACKAYHQREAALGVDMVREVLTLREAVHWHLVTLLEARTQSDGGLALVLEDGGSTLGEAAREGRLAPLVALYAIAQGVAHLHERGFMHRDLKPQNVLCDAAGHVRVCDLGSARALVPGRTYTEFATTLWYAAPEVLYSRGAYDEKVDTWAMGCILAYLLRGARPVFAGMTRVQMLFEIFGVLGAREAHDAFGGYAHYDAAVLPAFRERLAEAVPCEAELPLLRALLCAKPNARWSARALVRALERAFEEGAAPPHLSPSCAPPAAPAAPPLTRAAPQPELSHETRRILVDWMLHVARRCCGLDAFSALAAVAMLDDALRRVSVARKELQLVGCAALLLVNRALDDFELLPEDVVALADGAFTPQALEAMARRLLVDVGVRLHLPLRGQCAARLAPPAWVWLAQCGTVVERAFADSDAPAAAVADGARGAHDELDGLLAAPGAHATIRGICWIMEKSPSHARHATGGARNLADFKQAMAALLRALRRPSRAGEGDD